MVEEQQTQEPQEPEVKSPGTLLKQAREQKSLSIEQVAAKLYLKPALIDDIENDQYDEQMSLTFVKGYLKLYAKHLELDEKSVLDAFEQQGSANKTPAQLQSFSKRIAKETSDDRLMLVTYFIVLVIIALAVWWWWQQSQVEETARSTPSAVIVKPADNAQAEVNETSNGQVEPQLVNDPPSSSVDAAIESAAVESGSMESTQEPVETVSLAEQLQSQEPIVPAPESPDTERTLEQAAPEADGTDDQGTEVAVAEASAAAEPTETIPELPVQAADSSSELELAQTEPTALDSNTEAASTPVFDDADAVELVFQFTADCWVNIVDATGEAVAYGVKAEGRVMPVSGYPPFEVVLGAPEVVQISYNGAAVDMSGFRAGRTARFSLPLAN